MANAPQTHGPAQQGGTSSAPHGHVRVGDYELGDVVGDRGTGTVHCARHVPTDKQVAIKILHSRRQDVVDGLVRGAKAVSRVHHPNLVDITDVGATRDGTVFLAMELLSGESLQDRLHRVGPLPLFEAINIVRQVAHGLGAAHAADVVHGGLEPAKIFLCRRDGRRRVVRRHNATDSKLVVEPEGKFDLVKLLDLGLKRFLDLASYQSDIRETARYWSPEQAQRRPIDVRSDIYSLGAVFYEMITGTVPFDGASLAEVLRQHVSGLVTAPSQRSPGVAIDALVDTVILRCLQKAPALRFASTDELCDALDACVTDCAFLRDAHRLPGIEDSGIPLPEVRTKPRHTPEKAEQPAAQVPAPRSHKSETSTANRAPAPVGTKSPATPKPQAAPPAANVAKPTTTSPPRVPEPTRTTQSRPAVLEKSPVRSTPPLPPLSPPAASRGAPPPMPAPVAKRTPVAKTAAPTVPVTHGAPPALAKAATPPELIPTVDQSALTEIVTPPPIALSSDLLTEIADLPVQTETSTATGNADTSAVSTEVPRPAEPEAPAPQVTAPVVGPESGKTAEPQATVLPAEASSAIPEPSKPAEAEATASMVDAASASPESSAPVEHLPAAAQAPSAVPAPGESPEAEMPASDHAEQDAHAEASKPDEPETAGSPDLNRGDRVDGSDDREDELLAATWETWRRPKIMVLAGVAVLGVIAIAVWANRGKPASPTSARQAVAKASPPPPETVPTPAPAREPTPSQAALAPSQVATPSQAAEPPQAATPPAPTPVSGTPPLLAAAEETPPTPLLPTAPVPPPVVAEANKVVDKPTVPAVAAEPVAPAATPAEAVRPSQPTPPSPVAAATSEPKPASPRPRAVSAAAKPATPSTRDLTATTEAAATPKPPAAAPANLPPRLASAWATAARPAPAPAPAAPLPAVRPATKSSEQSKAGGSKAVAQATPATADQLVREAQQAWMAGQHALALSRAQSALGASPKPGLAVQAYEIVATCSCALHKRDRALEAASHLDTARRESVKAVCAKNGVPFE